MNNASGDRTAERHAAAVASTFATCYTTGIAARMGAAPAGGAVGAVARSWRGGAKLARWWGAAGRSGLSQSSSTKSIPGYGLPRQRRAGCTGPVRGATWSCGGCLYTFSTGFESYARSAAAHRPPDVQFSSHLPQSGDLESTDGPVRVHARRFAMEVVNISKVQVIWVPNAI